MIYNAERPVNFDQMVGQTLVVENIRNQSIKDQFFPVFILCGQYGSGKTTMARIIAMAANCDHKDERGNPCGQCDSCRAVMEHSAEGIIEIDGASNNGVDNVRKLLMQASTIGIYKKKVIVIDEAHMLSKSAFNALLITLENPPEHCIFILCTTEKEALPETVVSRAPVYMFGKIPDDLIKAHILMVAGKNEICITEDAAGMLARYANGAMRNALQLLEHLSLQKLRNEEITDTDVIRILGLSSLEQRAEFLNGCLTCDLQKIIQTLRECERRGLSLRTFIQDVLEMNTDLLLCKAGAKIVGTHFYMEKIHELENVSNPSIIKANKMLSVIAATPNNLLSVERIVADAISVMHEPEPVIQTIIKAEEKPAEAAKPMKAAEVLLPKEQPAEEVIQVSAPETTAQKANAIQEPLSDGFTAIPEGAEIPFEESTVIQQTETEHKESTEEDNGETFAEAHAETEEDISGFDLFGGGLFGGGFMTDTTPKKKKTKSDSMDLMLQMAVAGAAPMPTSRPLSDETKNESEKVTEKEDAIRPEQETPEEPEAEQKEEPVMGTKSSAGNQDPELDVPDSEPIEKTATDEGVIRLKDSIPVQQEGRITWDQAAEMGIVPPKEKLCFPKPESEEELDAIYEKMEEEAQTAEEDEIEETGYASRSDLVQANEELSRLLKNPGFNILFKKARVVEENFHIYLCFQNAAMVSAMKIFLTGVKGISARLDKE